MPDEYDVLLDSVLPKPRRVKSNYDVSNRKQSTYEPDEALNLIAKYESGDRNVRNYRYDPTHTAQGNFQIVNKTWRGAAPQANVDLKQYPTAETAPRDVQARVAKHLYKTRGFADWAPYNPRLKAAIERGERFGQSAQPRARLRAQPQKKRDAYDDLLDEVAPTQKTTPRVADEYDKLLDEVTPSGQTQPADLKLNRVNNLPPTPATTPVESRQQSVPKPTSFWGMDLQRPSKLEAGVRVGGPRLEAGAKVGEEQLSPAGLGSGDFRRAQASQARQDRLNQGRGAGELRRAEGKLPQGGMAAAEFRRQEQAEMGRLNRIRGQVAAEQTAGEQQIGRAPNTAQTRLFDPKLTNEEEVLRRISQEQGVEQADAAARAERERLQGQFTESDKQQLLGLAAQLKGRDGGVKRGMDVAIQRGMSSALYKLAGAVDLGGLIDVLPSIRGVRSSVVDNLRRKALAGELALEDIQDLPKPAREKVAEFLTETAIGLTELAVVPGGIATKFATLAGTEAQGRNRPLGEVLQETGKGAAMGAVQKFGEGIAPATASRVRRLGTAAPVVGLGSGAVELATGGTPEQAAQSALTNAVFQGAVELGRAPKARPRRLGETQTKVPDIEGILAKREQDIRPSEEVNVPERPETIQAQLAAVQQGTRPAVLVTRGEKQPNTPRGMSAVRTSEGTFYYDPKQVSRETLLAKVKDGTYGEVLGHVEPKSEVTTEAVVARAADGTEVQASAVSPENVAKQAEVLQTQHPEATIETGGNELAQKVIQDRVAPEVRGFDDVPLTERERVELDTFFDVESGIPEGGRVPPKPAKLDILSETEVAPKPTAAAPIEPVVAKPKTPVTETPVTPEKSPSSMTQDELFTAYRQNMKERTAAIESNDSEGIKRTADRMVEIARYGGDPEMSVEGQRAARQLNLEPWQKTKTEYLDEVARGIKETTAKDIARASKKEGGINRTQKFLLEAQTNRLAKENRYAREVHKRAVEQAIREGKSIPPEVLADYPDLAPKTAETPRAATPELQRHADKAASLRAELEAGGQSELARAALERQIKKLDTKATGVQERRSGADPMDLIDDIIIYGDKLIRKGKAAFDEWAKDVREKFGKDADPHLREIYSQLKGGRDATSIKNEASNELRAELDLAEMERPERKSWETAIENAQQKGLIERADKIADEVIQGGRERGLDYEEAAALLVKIREAENRWEEAYRNDPNDPALVKIKAELDKYSQAVDIGGTEVARALGIRRAMMDKSFRLISLIRTAEKAKGRKVTAEEVARYDELVKERDAALKARDEALAKVDAERSQETTEKFVQEEKIKIRRQGRRRSQEKLLAERVELKKEISALFAKITPKTSNLTMGGIADLNPKDLGDLTRALTNLARNYIESGVIKSADLVDAVHSEIKDVADLSKREVSDVISGYGRIRKSTTDPIEQKLHEIKSILAATSGKADVLEKGMRPLRRGQQREKPTEDQRHALRELNEAMRERGVELGQRPQNVATQQATPLDKAKTTVRNRIEQLQGWLAEGKREVEGRTAIIPDAELKQLQAERAGLERAAKLLDDPAADQKAIEKRLTEINKSITSLQEKGRSGQVGPTMKEGDASRWSAEIGQMEKERAALRRVVTDMRNTAAKAAKEAAATGESQTPFHGAEQSWTEFEAEAKRSLARVKELDKQAAEWERKRLAREYEQQAKTKTSPKYNDAVRRAEREVQAAENKFRKEMERERGGHHIRNISGMMKASLLGPKTTIKNFFGTFGWGAFEEEGRIFASLMDGVIMPTARKGAHAITGRGEERLTQRGIMGLSPSAVISSLRHGAKEGGRQAWDILRRGMSDEQMERHQVSEIDFGRTGNKKIDAGLQTLELSFNSVFRFLSASDRLFYEANHRRNVIDRAEVIARNEGLRGAEAKQRAKELVAATEMIKEKTLRGERISELVAQLDADAKYDALESTFNNDNTITTRIKRARATVINPRSKLSAKGADRLNALGNLGLDFLVPFDRTPTNIVARLVEASPLGYTKNAAQIGLALKRGGFDVAAQRNFSRTFGRATAGTMNMALGALLYDKVITIDDHDQAFLDLGFTKINLNTISPLGNLIGFGARMMKAYRKGEETADTKDDASKWDYVKPALKEVSNVPILRASQPLAEAAQDPERNFSKVAARYVGMAVPFSGAQRDLAKLLDPEEYRYPKGFKDTVRQGVPFLRERVDVSRSPLFEGVTSSTPATKEVRRLAMRLTGVQIGPEETAEEFEARRKEIAPVMQRAIDTLVETDKYQKLSDEEKRDAIKEAMAAVRASWTRQQPEKREKAERPQREYQFQR